MPMVRCSATSVRKLPSVYEEVEISVKVTCAWCSFNPTAFARRDMDALMRYALAPDFIRMRPRRSTTCDCATRCSCARRLDPR